MNITPKQVDRLAQLIFDATFAVDVEASEDLGERPQTVEDVKVALNADAQMLAFFAQFVKLAAERPVFV